MTVACIYPQIKTNVLHILFIKVVNLGYMDFVNCIDYKSIKVKEFRIRTSKCLLKKLEVDGSI
jgi:hypothetical protein